MQAAWRSMKDLPPVGMICELKLRDQLGEYMARGDHFLHDDGHWYKVRPPTKIAPKVVAWRPRITTKEGE